MTNGTQPAKEPMSAKTAALITVGSVMALLAVIGLVGGGYYLFVDRADQIESLEQEVETLEAKVQALNKTVAEANRRARQEYTKGYQAATEAQQDLQTEFGPLSGFDPGWYIVEFAREDGRIVIDGTFDFLDCELTYRNGSSVFTRPNDNPC